VSFPDNAATENNVARPNTQPQTTSFPLSEEVFLQPTHGTALATGRVPSAHSWDSRGALENC